MRLEYQILAAVGLDLLLGDPRWLPHPVRGIGWLAQRLERPTRAVFSRPRVAGVLTASAVIGAAGLGTFGLIALATWAHPIIGDAVSVVLIYTTVASRDLARHSLSVYRGLAAGDLPEAQRRVAMMVGRDTDALDEAGVSRATVESVAENIVDGVTAPLLFAVLAGPVGAMVYRAINTLDSTFGYKNERYLKFGWASARIDDLANYLPARLTAPLICLAAALLYRQGRTSFQVLLRDARNHPSPNAGFAEAAVAGALRVRLGGINFYFGKPSARPTMGDAIEALRKEHIPAVNALMFVSSGLFLATCVGLRHLTLYFREILR